jgi:MraZ protein
LEKKIDGLSALEPSVQAFNRFYLSAGQELELDTQNRLVVPQSLRKYAGLEGSLILVGMGDKFEIWDSETWSKVFSRLTDDFENLQVQVSQLAKGDGR